MGSLGFSCLAHMTLLAVIGSTPLEPPVRVETPVNHEPIRIHLISVSVSDEEPDDDESELLRFRDPQEFSDVADTEERGCDEPVAGAVEVLSLGPDAEEGYWDAVRRAVAEELRYPSLARRRGIEDTVVLRLTIDASGRLLMVEPVDASGGHVLAGAAVGAVCRAAPFPPLADHDIAANAITAELPIRFAMAK